MKRKIWFLRGVVALAAVAYLGTGSANATVIYSENFEGFTIDNPLTADPSNVGSKFYYVNPTTLIAANPPDGQQKLVVRSASSTGLPDEGLTSSNIGWSGSQFLEWHDQASAGISNFMAVGEFTPITASPFSFSFDFYEPSGFPATGGTPSGSGSDFTFTIGNTADGGTTSLNTTANRGINVIFGEPDTTTPPRVLTVIAGSNTNNVANAYTLDHKHTLQIFGNYNTGGALTYKGGVESVADNTYDLWLDGTKILDDQTYRNALSRWNSFGLQIGANLAGTDVKYIDNLVMTDDLNGPPTSVVGDYNGNGVVDAADYVLWRKDPTNPANGYVSDPSDGYNTWRANFGGPAGSGSGLGSSNVPEPTTLSLGGALLTLTIFGRRRK